MSHSCREHLGELSDYLEGDLNPEICAEIERHLAECGDCRIVVDTLRKTIMLYRTYGHEEVPADAKARLVAVLALEQKRQGNSGSQTDST
jgi:predicted anti-sigma-YlaC factor YlaD